MSIRKIAFCAVCVSLYVILGMYGLVIGNFIKISFDFIPVLVISYLAGPLYGGLCGGLGDILLCLIRPTGPYFIGFTLIQVINGILYGVILFNKKVSFKRMFICGSIKLILTDIFLSAICLHILYGDAISVILPARIFKALIVFVIFVFLGKNVLRYIEKSHYKI